MKLVPYTAVYMFKEFGYGLHISQRVLWCEFLMFTSIYGKLSQQKCSPDFISCVLWLFPHIVHVHAQTFPVCKGATSVQVFISWSLSCGAVIKDLFPVYSWKKCFLVCVVQSKNKGNAFKAAVRIFFGWFQCLLNCFQERTESELSI